MLRVAQTGCQTRCNGMQNADRSFIPRLEEEEEEGGGDLPEFVDVRPERVKQIQPFGPVTKSLRAMIKDLPSHRHRCDGFLEQPPKRLTRDTLDLSVPQKTHLLPARRDSHNAQTISSCSSFQAPDLS